MAASDVYSLEGGDGTPSGLNANLWSVGTIIPIDQTLGWDPAFFTGFEAPQGSIVLGVSADAQGSTAVQIAPDSSEIGVIINTDDLTDAATPDKPVPFQIEYPFPAGEKPFADPAVAALTTTFDLQVPYAEFPGSGASISSSQIVLYINFTDAVSGRTIAYGLNLFDSRGFSQDIIQSSVDNGVGGTGAAIVTVPAGMASPYAVPVQGAVGFQGAAWTGMQGFAFEITPQTLQAVIGLANAGITNGPTFSTDVANYSLGEVALDAEVEYFGQQNAMAYSLANLDVTETSTVSITSAQATAAAASSQTAAQAAAPQTAAVQQPDNAASSSAGGQTTVSAGAAGSVLTSSGLTFLSSSNTAAAASSVSSGAGGLTLQLASSGNDTLVGGAQLVRTGSAGGTITATSGIASLLGGVGAETLVGGSGTTTMVAGTGRDLFVINAIQQNTIIQGFNGTLDTIHIPGVTATAALATAVTGAWGTMLRDASGHTIAVYGAQHLTASNFA